MTRLRLVAALVVVALLGGGGLAAAAVASAAPAEVHASVLGGTPAPPTFTFVAALLRPPNGNQGRHFCGAALISPTWLLTAAHCAQVAKDTPGVTALIGRADIVTGTNGEERAVKAVHQNPGFTPGRGGPGDIALLELDRPSAVTPVAMATTDVEPAWTGARNATIAGWGLTSPTGGPPSSVLLSAAVPVFPEGTCSQLGVPNFSSPLLLCGGDTSTSACNGDSGGPLIATDTKGRVVVVGLSSFGPQQCGQSPSFYARVSGFVPWLQETMATKATTPTTPVTAAPTTTTVKKPVATTKKQPVATTKKKAVPAKTTTKVAPTTKKH